MPKQSVSPPVQIQIFFKTENGAQFVTVSEKTSLKLGIISLDNKTLPQDIIKSAYKEAMKIGRDELSEKFLLKFLNKMYSISIL